MTDGKVSHQYFRCGLEYQVRIVATQPETADANDDMRLVDYNRFTVDLKRCFFDVQVWVVMLEVKGRRYHFVLGDQDSFDQSSHARGPPQMPDVAFDAP
ncbi:hypothetical protein D3C87_1199040 [compost metagenome]